MDVPLQIAFHKADKPDWAEDQIRGRVAKLQAMYGRLVGCRVTVDQRAQNMERSIPPVVRIELSLPGTAPLVVAYEPERLQQEYQNPDLRKAINHAFAIAERRLSELKEARNRRAKQGAQSEAPPYPEDMDDVATPAAKVGAAVR